VRALPGGADTVAWTACLVAHRVTRDPGVCGKGENLNGIIDSASQQRSLAGA
jgi:hypothetical protein